MKRPYLNEYPITDERTYYLNKEKCFSDYDWKRFALDMINHCDYIESKYNELLKQVQNKGKLTNID